jgi:hypothetical protein
MLDMCTGILAKHADAHGRAVDGPTASSTSVRPIDSGVKDPKEANLRTKFRKYISEEESWLDENLKNARYDLDSEDSVHFVLGTGQRIEEV